MPTGRKRALRKATGLRVRRRVRKREEIIKASLKVFAEKGYHGATMDDIALELEATKGLLYYHFKTKEEILNAILAENRLIAGIEAGIGTPQGMPLREALRAVVRGSLALMESSGELVRFLHVQALLSRRSAESVYTRVLDRLYEAAARWLEPFKRSGEVRPDVNGRTWGRMLVDFITSHFLQKQTFGKSAQPPADYVDRVLEILLNGICVRKAQCEGER